MSICTRAGVMFAAALLALGADGAWAQTFLGKHGAWEAFSEKEDGKTICYIGSDPVKMRGKYKSRGPSYVMVTHRPADRSTNVVSVRAGYTYKSGSQPAATIGKSTFKLFAKDGWAFTPDRDTDDALVTAMIRGATMVVRGTSSRGTKTTDTYSLKGFTAAYRAIGKACKVR